MKVLFVGPSLSDATQIAGAAIIVRPPACQGDILRAVKQGATVLGLVDGNFEQVAPVWHKEILYALSLGLQVFGAASMGALRALECGPHGMIGVGEIYEWYRSGRLVDDADVAQIHGPADLDYVPLSIPLVNVLATLDALVKDGLLNRQEAANFEQFARTIFFKDRSAEAMAELAKRSGLSRAHEIAALVMTHLVDQKRLDALALIDRLRLAKAVRNPWRVQWQFNSTSIWRRAFTSDE